MSESEQITAFGNDLDVLLNRYCQEFDLSTASAVGVLAFKMHTLMSVAEKNYQDSQEED